MLGQLGLTSVPRPPVPRGGVDSVGVNQWVSGGSKCSVLGKKKKKAYSSIDHVMVHYRLIDDSEPCITWRVFRPKTNFSERKEVSGTRSLCGTVSVHMFAWPEPTDSFEGLHNCSVTVPPPIFPPITPHLCFHQLHPTYFSYLFSTVLYPPRNTDSFFTTLSVITNANQYDFQIHTPC